MLSQFPGRLINAELPKLPRPEIGKIMASSIFGKQTIFHPSLNTPSQVEDKITIIRRVQRHVLENRLRVGDFFKVMYYNRLCTLFVILHVVLYMLGF